MPSDEDLFRAWQKGSAAALEALVQRYHAPLLAHLYHLLGGDVQSAEDLVQEAFVSLVRDASAYQYPRPFRPWLYTIARRLALNDHASAYKRHVDLRAPIPEREASESDPAIWLERWEQQHELRQALGYLSFEQREILSLRYGEQLSVKELAIMLGIPEGTVKSRTFHALRQLRLHLKQPVHRDVPERRGQQYG
ncbi:RNA polymerase sigma24 factor [Ktedonobacter sp. SOSP1-52]|uniref:RNA polymerase sigma factor n=1 Tax=Ktedonobacter sp. SOSP1-52 TaxID=2778366 RepID=UPI0019150B08|nr:RNA polymerase sigma factor [Ktedonobacter sp. SOSP1-52]GHO63442.1 RNA polymerase sigma24 factor [Ktedonobacter sp. SOSP1-52]